MEAYPRETLESEGKECDGMRDRPIEGYIEGSGPILMNDGKPLRCKGNPWTLLRLLRRWSPSERAMLRRMPPVHEQESHVHICPEVARNHAHETFIERFRVKALQSRNISIITTVENAPLVKEGSRD